MKHIVSLLGGLIFWGFIATKMVGHVFAAWSWWWLFLPLVPWLGLAVQRLRL